MLSEESVLEISILARQGKSIRAIAAELGIARNTVRRYLRGERPAPEPNRRGPGRPRTLERYEQWLTRRVEHALPHRLPATVLTRELAAMGYRGTERTVRRFVAPLYAAAEPEPIVRYESAPGQQTQMDWGEYRLDGRKVYAFVGLLGASRHVYVEYVESMRVATLLACHERMFVDFGGVTREILYDNMRTVVTQRDAYGRSKHRFQDEFLELARRHGFRPVLCRPYRPQTKGKVERVIRYIAESFFHPLVTRYALEGRTLSLETLNAEATLWRQGVANRRVHATTGRVPAEALLEERAVLMAAAAPPVSAPLGAGADTASGSSAPRWPRERLQRSPREYERLLEHAAADAAA